MATQPSSKVTGTTPASNLPPPDLRGLPVTNPESEAEQIAPERSVVMQGNSNGDLRHRMISEAAYQLYAQRGYVDGSELADWLQAEAEVDRLVNNRMTTN